MSGDKRDDSKKSLDELWTAVRKNSSDFNAWTALLGHVEQNVLLVGINSVREAFSAFFARYPYCYGYWKKLADLEKKNVQDGEEIALDRCRETFDQGLEAIPLSVDLWLQYVSFMKQWAKERGPEGDAELRTLYERAAVTCGLEFRSDRLWDSWIAWETEQKQLVNVTAIYDRLIRTPTQLYQHHHDKLQGLLEKYPPHETLSEEELEELRAIYDQKKGEGAIVEEEASFIKKEAMQRRKDVFKKTEEAVRTRWTFEEGIKRPYFHVKPLEKSQIKNWKDYLDLEIEMGDPQRIRMLFERCLIACALYEDMWMKYISWAQSVGDSAESILALFKRACQTHLPKKPTINLAWLAFVEKNERNGSLPAGSSESLLGPMEERLCGGSSGIAGCIVFSMRRLHILRRLGRPDEVDALFKKLAEDAKPGGPKMVNHFVVKHARFLAGERGDTAGALALLREAIKREPENVRTYLTMIELAMQSGDQALAEEAFDSALKAPEVPQARKLEMLQRKFEFFEEMTCDVAKAQCALEEYTKMLKVIIFSSFLCKQ
ncbi:pre-mRNA-processing factor 39-like [Tropilaelaps mercedesae]|uniref:Pre-mRNA-processing factor 39-like n=1 Tax=Tropilaelaps mercedesae TaxID=418985 RepID=A0A1V9XXE9_9ACAR|nr:pre-mRNA-processing factor 39-like [Tropilaelaps mercedesae]